MDWIKVKVQHAEYQMSSAPDNVFKAWIMVMVFVAATECKPLRKALCNRLGEINVRDLEDWLVKNDTKLDTVIDKVLEDVDKINLRKAHNNKYMQEYRGKPLRKPLRGQHVMGKRREEKRREDKKLTRKPFLDFKYLEEQNLKNLLKAMGGDKEALKAHLKEMHFHEARIIEALEKARIV